MAETRSNVNLTPTIWDDRFSTEFFQTNPFAAYQGTGNNNVIRVKEDYQSKRGNGITFEFITNLQRGTIYDRQPLRGHEDALGEYGDRVYWRMRKKGIAMHELDEELAAINLRDAARGSLKTWATQDLKWDVIDRLGDVGANCDVPWATAATADKNTWVTNNSDRVLFGATVSNYSTTFATAAGNVDNVNDLLNRAFIRKLKAIALAASPKITPIEVEAANNRRFFVAFVPSLPFIDFQNDTDSVQAQVRVIERNEAIFLGGDREFDGVIVHQVDDITSLGTIGNGSTNVYPVYLCGQEAIGMAVKERYRSRTQMDDYQQEIGLGMIGKWGSKKLCYSNNFNASLSGTTAAYYGKQRGVVTGFVASTGL
jgi:hypothetical protein